MSRRRLILGDGRSVVVSSLAVGDGRIIDGINELGDFFSTGLGEKLGALIDLARSHGALGAVGTQPIAAVFGIAGPEIDTDGLMARFVVVKLGGVNDAETNAVVLQRFLIPALTTIGLLATVVAILEQLFDAQADVEQGGFVKLVVGDGRQAFDSQGLTADFGNLRMEGKRGNSSRDSSRVGDSSRLNSSCHRNAPF